MYSNYDPYNYDYLYDNHSLDYSSLPPQQYARSPPPPYNFGADFSTINAGDLGGLSNYGQPLNPASLSATASALAGTRSASANQYGSYSTELKVNQDPGSGSSFGRNVGYQRVIGVDGHSRTVPICPDIKMKELPFYDILAVLLRPTSLLNQGQSPKQEAQHSFCLSPSQAGEITNSREVVQGDGGYSLSKIQYLVQVQLRFCALDSTTEQEDLFPQGLVVKVNGRVVQLPAPIPSNRPGVEPKRPSKPLNITTNVKCCPLSTNTIHVSWIADSQRSYCMQVNMVKKLTADLLFSRLKQKRIQPADFTRGRIKEITTAEEEDLCAPTSIRVSVACPLGKSRMTWPCRATTCKHLQCFDANLFLLMNERKPTFVCPVCNKQLKFNDLCIDGYFMDVIKNLSIDLGNEIELFADGSWLPAIKLKSEAEDVGPPAPKRLKPTTEPVAAKGLNETIDLDDEIAILDDDEEEDTKPKGLNTSAGASSSSSSKPQQSEPEIIDLLSSDDEEETFAPPPTPRVVTEEETMQSVLSQPPQQEQAGGGDESTDSEEIGIRPRRRNKKISYVEESSSDSSTTNEGDQPPATPSGNRQPRSPACIELSDSPSPEPAARPFASVGSGGGSSHHQQQSSTSTQSRSGSGSSSTTTSLYSSSPMPTASSVATTPTTVRAGAGSITTGSSSTNTSSSLHPTYLPFSTSLHPAYYSAQSTASSTYSTSASSSSTSTAAGVSSSTTASHFFPPNVSVPGYTAYDSGRLGGPHSIATWEDDLSSFINQHTLSYTGAGGPSLESLTGSTSLLDEYINIASAGAVSGHHPFSTSSSTSSSTISGLFHHPHHHGGGAGGTSSGFTGGWM